VADHDGNLRATFFHRANDLASVWEGQLDRSPKLLFRRCARFLTSQCRELQIGSLPTVGLRLRCFLQFALFDSLGRTPTAQSISSHSRCRRRPDSERVLL
jgi:hypothetical protein